MKYITVIRIRQKWFRLMILLFFCFFGVLTIQTKAEAATTCSSVISVPAKTNGKVNMRKKAGTKYKSYGYVENGSAIITEPNGNITYVKKSGDLKLKEQKLHEITFV